jgi:hypothetical protein
MFVAEAVGYRPSNSRVSARNPGSPHSLAARLPPECIGPAQRAPAGPGGSIRVARTETRVHLTRQLLSRYRSRPTSLTWIAARNARSGVAVK